MINHSPQGGASTKRILITGGTGMLGADVFSTFGNTPGYEVYSVSRMASGNNKNHLTGDLTDAEKLKVMLRDLQPEIIIHCAAQVNVNACETDKEYADAIHVKATENLAKYSSAKQFIYISTDSVFDGQRGNYSETDVTNPLNYYALTKLRGEEAAARFARHYAIIRTNIIGFHQPIQGSLFEWAYKSLSSNTKIKGFDNVMFNPMYCAILAEKLVQFLGRDFPSGIYNFGASDAISKYEFLRRIAGKFNFDETLITAEKLVNDPEKGAIRPLNTSLNVSKVTGLGLTMPTMDENIDLLYKDFKANNNEGKQV